ncbi:hypothetical protein [Pleionea litopenaei]|uniref:Group-specific protein n=1 Tax=Pleionea litopenaei TaxID=3070815 RepID=A0AA51X782_9GAMM|nr:hypothetical protein [Pleionea sp. HL-JVS1]WMS87611.1 hypothetical protein Q9312_01490 [Pleionea sp. HL-JVS1]
MDELVVAVVKYRGNISYYRCERENWVLDLNKLRDAFNSFGYSIPELDDTDRFGIHTITDGNVELFLDKMKAYKVDKEALSLILMKRFPVARSWWDVGEIFPLVFVDFDRKTLGAFYYEGVKMEKYIPDGWTGEFIDFANEYPEDIFPASEKFWIKEDSDLLKLLNERGASQK